MRWIGGAIGTCLTLAVAGSTVQADESAQPTDDDRQAARLTDAVTATLDRGPLDLGLDFGDAASTSWLSLSLMQDPVLDQPADDAPDPNAWRVSIQPYIWLPIKIQGSSTIEGATVAIDADIGDVFDAFDKIFVLSGRVEAWRGDWGLVFDGMYVNLESEFDVRFPDGSFSPNLDITIRQAIMDLGVGCRLVDQRLGDDGPRRLIVDVFGGGRIQYLKQEIDVPAAPTLGDSFSWAEIMFGGRVALFVTDNLAFAVIGNASGFGIGSASDLTYNIYAGADIYFSPKFNLKAGYRYFDIDYERGSGDDAFGMDMSLHGPYLGFAFVF